MNNIKVAYMLGSLNRGGTETLVLDVFRNANKVPFQFIGIHRKGGAYRDDFYAAGPKMIQCAPKRFGYIRYLMQLRRLIKSENINIVHTQHWLDCIYAYLATIGLSIQVALTLHGYFPQNGLVGILCRTSIRIADDVCFVSRYEQDWYQSHCYIPDSKCHVIYNGVDFRKFDFEDKRILGFEDERDRRFAKICMVGNFVKVRDHITLFRALRLLNERGRKDFDFYFIGKRVEEQAWIYDECKRICEKYNMTNVHFMGGRGDVPVLLKSMDGFVYSTDHDTFGIAVVEAMAVGLPVVVNDYAVMREVCGKKENHAVTYFHSKDVGGCADAIEKLLFQISESTTEFKTKCANNAQWVHEQYSIEAYLKRLHNIYSV